MSRSVGLDITETAVRAVEFESSGRRLRLVRFVERPLQPAESQPWADAAAEAVASLFAEHRLPREGVVAALDSGEILFRLLSLPFRTDDQLRKVVKFELESQLQNYSADDLIVDHVAVERDAKGTLLLAAAAPKKVVRARLALLERAGVDAAALDLDVNALANVYARGGEEAPFVVAHGGPRFTRLVLIHHGIPRFVRALRFAIATDPDAEPSSAPAEAGGADRPAILAREISRFLLSSQAGDPPVRIVLSGSLARRPGLGERLTQETTLPVVEDDLLDGVEHPFGDAGSPAHLAVPFGLALKGLGLARTRLDFRQEEFVHQRPYERVRRTLASAVFLSALLLLLAAVHFHIQSSDLRGQLDRILDQQQKVVAEVFPDRAARVEDRETLLDELKRAWREEGEKRGQGSGALTTSALEPVGAVFTAMRELLARQTAGGRNPDFHIALESLNYTLSPKGQGLLEFTGRISNPPLGEALQNTLKADTRFETVSLEGLSARPDGKYNFTIKLALNGTGTK